MRKCCCVLHTADDDDGDGDDDDDVDEDGEDEDQMGPEGFFCSNFRAKFF